MSASPVSDGTAKLSVTGRIAGWSAGRRWLIVAAAAASLVVAIVLNVTVEVKTNQSFGAGEALEADRLFAERFDAFEPPAELMLFSNPSLDAVADAAAFRAVVDPLVAELRELEGVAGVVSYYDIGLPAMVSSDGHVALARLEFEAAESEEHGQWVGPVIEAVDAAAQRARDAGFEVAQFGGVSANRAFEMVVAADFNKVLVITLIGGLLILLLAFGSLIAAVIPLLMAVAAIFTAIGMAVVVSRVEGLNLYYYEMVLLMGLAVGIDYSLFVINRFREERAGGRSKLDAIRTASNTTGRAVLYAGTTVAVSLAGLLLVGDPLFTGLGLGAIIVVLLSILASLTLLPALLAILGDGVNRLRIPGLGRPAHGGGVWGRVTRLVLAHPVVAAGLALAGMVALAVPLFSLHLGSTPFNSENAPAGFEFQRGLELMEEHFGLAETAPLFVVVDPGEGGDMNTPEVREAVASFVQAVEREAIFEPPFETQANAAGDLMFIRVPVVDPDDEQRSETVIRRLRSEFVPAAFGGTGVRALVTGGAGYTVDARDNVEAKAPMVFAFVLGLAFVLLLVMFRSIVIPVKAIVLNLLAVGAAYGVLVLVFQWGFVPGLLGFEAAGVIEIFMPLFLFAVLFGLSMDYHMLLLSRVREAYDAGRSNEESVALGVQATAAMITSAAAIMVMVFGAFGTANVMIFKQIGVGMGVAILLDATVIRVVLLPATMKLLGDWNWYLPSWLCWLPRVSVEGARGAATAATRGGRESRE